MGGDAVRGTNEYNQRATLPWPDASLTAMARHRHVGGAARGEGV